MCSYINKAGAAFFFFLLVIFCNATGGTSLPHSKSVKAVSPTDIQLLSSRRGRSRPPSPQTGTLIPKKERKASEFWSQQRQIYIVCLTHNAPLVWLDHSSLPPTLWPNGKPTPVLTYASYTVHTVSTIQLFLSPLHISSCCTTMHVQGSLATWYGYGIPLTVVLDS